MPVAPNTSASMIVRTFNPIDPNPNAKYNIYNLGQNQFLAADNPIGVIGDNWNFAGPGAVDWDFARSTIDLFVSRPNAAINANDFFVYNISGNALAGSRSLGSIGQPWQVAGFGYFVRSNFGQADMMMSGVLTPGNVTYRLYDTENNQFVSSGVVAVVGTNWRTAGFGTYATNAIDDPNSFAGLMVLQDTTSPRMVAYAFRDGGLVNLPDKSDFADIGSEWTVVGFGNFSSQFPLGMITRYTGTNPALQNQFLIYDIVQTFDQNNTPIYTAKLSNADVGFGPGVLTKIGSNAVVVGFAPISATPSVERVPADMVLRDTNTGKFYVCDIQDDKVTFSGELPQLSTSPIPASWTVGGIAPDFSATASAGATAQLAQAMAGFGDGSGAADGLNTTPPGADASQQQFLATPQHA
jgi:hypothetical protein